MLRNTATRYGLVARGFHWSIAVLFIGLIGLGWYMVGLSYYDPLYHDSLSWHRAIGLIVALLVVGRLAWMLVGPRPDPAATLTRFERIASRATHDLLRLAMVVLPVTGYLVSTSDGDAVSVFGLLEVPALIELSTGATDIAGTIHYYTAYGSAALIVLHVAGALKHRFLDKDDVLGRML